MSAIDTMTHDFMPKTYRHDEAVVPDNVRSLYDEYGGPLALFVAWLLDEVSPEARQVFWKGAGEDVLPLLEEADSHRAKSDYRLLLEIAHCCHAEQEIDSTLCPLPDTASVSWATFLDYFVGWLGQHNIEPTLDSDEPEREARTLWQTLVSGADAIPHFTRMQERLEELRTKLDDPQTPLTLPEACILSEYEDLARRDENTGSPCYRLSLDTFIGNRVKYLCRTRIDSDSNPWRVTEASPAILFYRWKNEDFRRLIGLLEGSLILGPRPMATVEAETAGLPTSRLVVIDHDPSSREALRMFLRECRTNLANNVQGFESADNLGTNTVATGVVVVRFTLGEGVDALRGIRSQWRGQVVVLLDEDNVTLAVSLLAEGAFDVIYDWSNAKDHLKKSVELAANGATVPAYHPRIRLSTNRQEPEGKEKQNLILLPEPVRDRGGQPKGTRSIELWAKQLKFPFLDTSYSTAADSRPLPSESQILALFSENPDPSNRLAFVARLEELNQHGHSLIYLVPHGIDIPDRLDPNKCIVFRSGIELFEKLCHASGETCLSRSTPWENAGHEQP